MSFGLRYDQLTPVAGNVRAGIVSYDGSNPEHRIVLREALPRFLGSLGAVHGEAFPSHHIDAVIDVANAKEIEVDFLLVAFNACSPVLIGGLATGAATFGAKCDENNNLRIFPVKHGEDLCVDKNIARLFREHTRGQLHPSGIGAGTWFMREQIRSSISKPHWVFAGRDNEHSPENPQIKGVMDKFGAVHGTEKDSAVLQLNGLPYDMKRRWGVSIETQALPADALGIKLCPNNFITRWSSNDGKQQIVVIYTKMASTFDGQPVVWTKIKSNGSLPDSEMVKEVLASLLSAGSDEISNRGWGSPRTKLANDLSHVFGSPVPVMHIHTSREQKVIDALLQMKADYRRFGNHTMLSGVMDLRNVRSPKAMFGQSLPEATRINGIDPERDAHRPYFGFESGPMDLSKPTS